MPQETIMELWLDTINYNLIENAVQRLSLTGVTTNPSILSQTKIALDKTIHHLLDIQPGFLAVQVTANNERDMLIQARNLSRLNDRMIVKIPVTQQGLSVIKQLSMENIATMATAIFETSQIYLSMLAGAKYAAPYFGRIEKESSGSLSVINDMLQSIKSHNNPLKLLAASISTKQQIMNCLLLGVHAITLPEKAYHELMNDHPLTMQCLTNFKKDWDSCHVTGMEETFDY